MKTEALAFADISVHDAVLATDLYTGRKPAPCSKLVFIVSAFGIRRCLLDRTRYGLKLKSFHH